MTAPLDPQVQIEFPLVQAASFDLYECSICHSLVRKEGAQPHAEWHSGEAMRNFSGF